LRVSVSDQKPVYRGRARVRLLEMDASPAAVFSSLANRMGAMFLDSAMIDRYGLGRWSFIVYDPLFIMSSRGKTVTFRIGQKLRWEDGDPFQSLRRTLGLFEVVGEPSWIPFRGGAAGFFSYELGRHVEVLPSTVEDDLDMVECWLGFYDSVLAYDHMMDQWFICHIDFGLKRPDLAERIKEAKYLASVGVERGADEVDIKTGPLESNFEKLEYMHSVERAREHIIMGDIYQVNLSQRFSTTLEEGSAWDLYERLRGKNAAPFASFIQGGGFQVLSSSPERFLKVNGSYVETRPIKGTIQRGSEKVADRWYKAKLLASKKDHAELSMIVDLERNDLGRVCDYGTVEVTRHAHCESYSRVHHLVSTVEGRIRPDTDVTSFLRATFPGGSITGAPKIRSMEIIDDLEKSVRNVYCGSIGYVGFEGDLDLNIAIRTMTTLGPKVYFSAGGGIVYDSDPETEYDETMDKAYALIEALGGRGGGF